VGWRLVHPDVTVNGVIWEIKSPEGNSKRNTIHHQFEQAKRQSANIIIDTARIGLNDEYVLDEIRARLRSSKQFVATMMVSKSGMVFLEEIC